MFLKSSEKIQAIRNEIQKRIIGQSKLVDRLLIVLFARGHMILEWVPGLAKTLAAHTLASALDLHFSRIQFTPDLLPSDLVWGQIYNQSESKFYVKKWPIFTNFLLADEINRAPAKVQSALLEAMQERQVTIADETFSLPVPFLVIATQNPLEQEWTYPLPEAQLDRFLLKTIVQYPDREEEIQIMKQQSKDTLSAIEKQLSAQEVTEIQNLIREKIFVDEKIYTYIRDIVFATRQPEDYKLENIKPYINCGASPRASIALLDSARVYAFLQWREYVIPEDIKELAPDVLRHRISLTFEAIGENIRADDIISKILDNIIVP